MRDAVQRSGLNEKKKITRVGPQRRRKEACMCACARTGDAARSERTTVHFLPCTPQHRLSLRTSSTSCRDLDLGNRIRFVHVCV